jgi:hypothetical protein
MALSVVNTEVKKVKGLDLWCRGRAVDCQHQSQVGQGGFCGAPRRNCG